jgi:hypothetical protein
VSRASVVYDSQIVDINPLISIMFCLDDRLTLIVLKTQQTC